MLQSHSRTRVPPMFPHPTLTLNESRTTYVPANSRSDVPTTHRCYTPMLHTYVTPPLSTVPRFKPPTLSHFTYSFLDTSPSCVTLLVVTKLLVVTVNIVRACCCRYAVRARFVVLVVTRSSSFVCVPSSVRGSYVCSLVRPSRLRSCTRGTALG